jgi:hypothetical protein
MKRLVEFPSDTGEPILVEVEDLGLSGETRRGMSASAVVERAQTSFKDALDRVRPMATSLVGKLRTMSDAAAPDEVQVEFGIVLSAEAGAVLAAASAGANYKVTMTWKRPPA